jgi:hypothetical protein
MNDAIFQWGFGICATGFFFLAGWIQYLNTKVSAVLQTAQKVDEIHVALLGDMRNEGIMSRTRRLEEQCKLRHGEMKLSERQA